MSRDSLATGRVIESYPQSDEERDAVRKRPGGPERVREGKGNEEEVEADQSQAEGDGIPKIVEAGRKDARQAEGRGFRTAPSWAGTSGSGKQKKPGRKAAAQGAS